jgi:hypothetical protein
MGPGGSGTKTGRTLEDMIEAALRGNNYDYQKQVVVGASLYGGTYKADFLVGDIIISCKWQQTKGTAEQKMIYEIASLIKIVRGNKKYRKAYIVLGGKGFSSTCKEYLLNQRHREILKHGDLVEIVSLDDLVALINSKKLDR